MFSHEASDRLYAGACESAPGGVHSTLRRFLPHLVFRDALGATLTDADGNSYIDYHCAFGPIVLGHQFERVNAAVRDAMQGPDLLGAGVSENEIRLAAKFRRHVPCAERVAFCNSGSEATYSAIRLARAVTGRKKIVKFQGCYHGWHDAVAMNVITPLEKLGRRDPSSAGSLDEVMDHTVVCDFNRLDSVEEAFSRHRGKIAALIVEPIQHNVGCVLPEPGFLEGLREITRLDGALLIFDEVITGFRHGLGGYQKIAGVTPDLATFGKAMANGYPIAAIAGRAELMDRFKTHPEGDVYFAGTYNAHPLMCAAALATIEALEDPATHAHLFALGARMRDGLADIAARLGIRAAVRGFGSIFVLYFQEGPIRGYLDLTRNDAARFVAYRRALLERGVFELPANLKRSHLCFSHTPEQVDRTLEISEDVLRRAG